MGVGKLIGLSGCQVVFIASYEIVLKEMGYWLFIYKTVGDQTVIENSREGGKSQRKSRFLSSKAMRIVGQWKPVGMNIRQSEDCIY